MLRAAFRILLRSLLPPVHNPVRIHATQQALLSVLAGAALILSIAGCGSSVSVIPPNAIAGRADAYDYSPSVLQSGNQLQIWWCGLGNNPENPRQFTDTILYETVDTVTNKKSEPKIVLGETPGAWDSVFTCNPKVVRGTFTNPFGDGAAYTYAMYYVGTQKKDGSDNSIGVAFSNDGMIWRKLKDPIIASTSATLYGAGQPAPYNQDGKSGIMLLYEDAGGPIEHRVATSTDGIHFTPTGKITRNGFNPGNLNPSWGDAGYDPTTHSWYATFDLPTRNPATTADYPEAGQYGFQLWRIPASSLVTGETPWQLLRTYDTNSTGYESNFLAGFLRDPHGNINIGSYPKLQLFPSIANPQPTWNATPLDDGYADAFPRWDIGSLTWDPGVLTLPLFRLKNQTGYETTTGYADPFAGFVVDATLGHLYTAPQNSATLGFYGCKGGTTDYFVSLDPGCAGAYIVGLEGYGYPSPPAGVATKPLYFCSAALGRFLSNDAQCEANGPGYLLGYALP